MTTFFTLMKISELTWTKRNHKTHTGGHTGRKRWTENLSLNKGQWGNIFKSIKTVCNEMKLREFHFKFIHRTVMTKGELFKYGIKPDDKYCFCGEKTPSTTPSSTVPSLSHSYKT